MPRSLHGPVELAYSDAHVPLKTNYGCDIRFLPLIPVAQRDGRDHAEGCTRFAGS